MKSADRVKPVTLRLVRLARSLRAAGVGVGLSDELDAAEALTLVDLSDREEVRRALKISLKVAPEAFSLFEELFESFWSEAPDEASSRRRQTIDAPRIPRAAGSQRIPDAHAAEGAPAAEGDMSGYSPEAHLRRKSFEELALSPRAIAAMERLLARLARRLATRRSRRLVPSRRGFPDPRRSFRRALGTGGEVLRFARRIRARDESRLVFLCDTSGSMDPHCRFLLTFILALRRSTRRAEVFVFNTSLVRLTPALARGNAAAVLARVAASVPDWSGGTRIGQALAEFGSAHLQKRVDAKTVVVILSDGLDRGEPEVLARALRRIGRRARRIVWLNPLMGDPRYEPTARGMQAALPFIDRFLPAHDLMSLERLLPHLKA